TAANSASSSALNRCDVSVVSSTSCIGITRSTGCSGSIVRTTPVAACATDEGGTSVRSTNVRLPGEKSLEYSYTVGIVASDSSPCLTSPTIPTTCLLI